MEMYFFGSDINRAINRDNVKNLYYSIKKWGVLTSLKKIKKVKSNSNFKIYKVSVAPKVPDKPVSIDNWDLKLEEVTDPTEKEMAEVVVDGQHETIACLIRELENDGFEFKAEYTETVQIPNEMSITEFINLLNSGRAWTNKDYKGKLKTGNQYIDYMEDKIIEGQYVSDFIYSLYTIGTANVSESLVKALKCYREDKIPKKLELNEVTQSNGDNLLAAFANSKLSKEAYNKGKLGKGLKKYAKDYKKNIAELIEVINKMDKDVWYNNEVPAGSPEIKDYVENFKKWGEYGS